MRVMRFYRWFLSKMLRNASRVNVFLAIICTGAVVLMWNKCKVEKIPKVDAHTELNSRDILPFKNSINNERYDTEDEGTTFHETNENSVVLLNEGENKDDENDAKSNRHNEQTSKHIEVLVNGETKIEGRLEDEEVYIPFSFVRDYFELEGKMVRDYFGKKFHIRHTNYEYFKPTNNKYHPEGAFLWFVNYNVEGRARVKCITGTDEVPISTQWGEQGYKYPIQIAQYGLSHYSMWKEKPPGKVKIVDDCERTDNQEWSVKGKGAYVRNVYDAKKRSHVIEFATGGTQEGLVILELGSSSRTYVLSLDVLFKSTGQISITVEVDDTKTIALVYDTSEKLLETQKSRVTYGIGQTREWRKISRNLMIDLNKALGVRGRKKKKRGTGSKLRITEIRSLALQGEGFIDNVTLMQNNHEAGFLASARWMLKNQDKKGGWPIPVQRKIKTGVQLKPGWYSAMAQGHAISLLVRAHHFTKDKKYLNAAKEATKLFHVLSKDNGILAVFMNKYKWYEEYPMTPSLFVLNGFLYSLMGLYDLKETLPQDERSEVEKLFQDGMTSLRAMILMYDSGSGTIYDLRHLTMGVEPNLARWDYHATHVNQLTWVTMINDDPLYKNVLKRWQGYFKGIRAKHN